MNIERTYTQPHGILYKTLIEYGLVWMPIPDTGRRKFNSQPYDGILWQRNTNDGIYIEAKMANKPLTEKQKIFARDCWQTYKLQHFILRIDENDNGFVVRFAFMRDDMIERTCAHKPAEWIQFLLQHFLLNRCFKAD